jgi:hypothetical protein
MISAHCPLGEMGASVSMHYHLRLYHLGRCLQDVEQVQARPAAMARARQLTEHVQSCLRVKTYRVRIEPCTLLHFPEPTQAHRRYP